MSLANYEPIRETVTSRRGAHEFSVRGLSLDDVVVLFNKHMTDVNRLFDLISAKDVNSDTLSEGVSIASRLVSEAPEVAARVIALACDEPELYAKARKITIPLQIEIIRRVVELTFDEAGGARNFQLSFQTMAAAMAAKKPTASNI